MGEVIVLVSPPPKTNRTPEENLGLEYLVAESKIAGNETYLLDAWMEKLNIPDTVERIFQFKSTVVGISPSMDSCENTLELCRLLRSRGYQGKIILGGIYASFEAENLIKSSNDFDGVLTGEADLSFQVFLKKKCLVGIPGAIYKKKNKVVVEESPKGIDNLDELPMPSRDTMDLVKKWKTPSHIMGSRGCYGNCSFCSVACFQKFSSEKRWRGRSPDNILRELIMLTKLGENMVKFVDDNFFEAGSQMREKAIAKLIINSGIKIRFRLSLRVNDVEEETIKLLKQTGLFAVSLGVE